MTTPSFPFQEQFTKLAEQGQEAANDAVRTWAEAVQRMTVQPDASVPGASVPDVSAIVDNAFDLAERLLEAQRELTKQVLQAVARSTADVTAATAQTVDSAADKGSQTASEAADAAAEAARNVADSTRDDAGATDTAAKTTRTTRSKTAKS
jgi:hypothetical protein